MDRKQIGVRLALEGLGLKFEIYSFNDRLVLQKSVYLAQAKGVHLGYFFKWYLHGPYCSELTADAFEINSAIESGMDDSDKWELDGVSLAKLREIKHFFSDDDEQRLATKLELLASVHFLVDRQQVKGKDAAEIHKILKNYKKPFDIAQVRDALRGLEEYGFFS